MTHKLCLRVNITQVPQSLPERTILNSSSSVEVPAQENRRGFNSISSRSVTNVLTRTYSSLYVALPSASLLDFELTRTQRERCLKVARELLEDGKSVAVGMLLPAATSQKHQTEYFDPDNTNADVKAREYWTELAKLLEIPIRCVHFTAPSSLCEHNDAFRSIGGQKLEVRTHASWAAGYREEHAVY